jgi:hypothetical protein
MDQQSSLHRLPGLNHLDDFATRRVERISPYPRPGGVAVSPDGREIYITCEVPVTCSSSMRRAMQWQAISERSRGQGPQAARPPEIVCSTSGGFPLDFREILGDAFGRLYYSHDARDLTCSGGTWFQTPSPLKPGFFCSRPRHAARLNQGYGSSDRPAHAESNLSSLFGIHSGVCNVQAFGASCNASRLR